MENDPVDRAITQGRVLERQAVIDRIHALPITKQAAAMGVIYGGVYYAPRPVSDAELAQMRRLDALPLKFPCAGARMKRRLVQRAGILVGHRHLGTLMRRMAIAPQPGTGRRHCAHPDISYLLRGRTITQSNHVWAIDITYTLRRAASASRRK